MSKELERGLLIGSSSVDAPIWVLRKAYGEKSALLAFLARMSNSAELELCASIASIMGRNLDSCLEKPQIAVSMLRDFVESKAELGIPVSVKELVLSGMMAYGREEREEEEQ
ncbi:hypothetical protein PYJP_04120 [Pyrofollis japonicus]|uniref:hypothetical protein n=1 Tax=Pyrofollis japonicus TaxID=3060460 RepID=UPI00295B6DF7|nr:hypothetical protein [Pyrofollis japonicus]BEP17060.1 hypothetical protein PYJP_04120 [Pyrofollis japonicus]